MRLILICLVATVGVALAKPQGYDFPSRNSGYDSNDRQGYGGGNNDRQGYGGGSNDRPGYGGGNNDRQGYGGGSGGYPDRTDFYPNNAAVNRVQNFYPSSSPASIGTTTTQSNRFGSTAFDRNFQQGSSTARPTGQGNFRPTGNAGFGATNNQFGNRPQFGSSGAGIGGFTTTNRPGVQQQQQQQFAGNFDGNSGFGATGVSGFAGNNPNNNFVSTTSQRPFPDSINSQLPDSPVVNANFPGNAGFVNSAVNSGRPTTTNAPFAINNGGAPFSRPNNNNGFGGSGSGNTRPFTGSNTRPFNGGNTRPFAGNNDRFGNNNNNNRPPFSAGSGGNSGFGNNGGNNGGFPVNSNNLNNDDLSEPANYEFSYEVNDPPSGQNFGHTERRQGDDTSGSYFVLLPDGRLQRVDYTAGVGGYRARVTYEDQGGQFRK
ncbi:pro-resilin-like isoform X2 [Neocloeon triangulifer]|uniref:pro-resilin-like isoform X2 n=1 Tax=Neocloeon triangulifer TaxID=2078957 RepID=UPI00286EDF37|nr:pro-resilin-like isoform X2 [Neocloeon triangulifer]